MASVGGDIIEITFNHPTLGSGSFKPKAGEDSEYNLGGLRNDDDNNNVDGGGEIIVKKNRMRWHFSIKCAWDMQNRLDLDNAIALAESNTEATYTFTHSNGDVRRGKGFPVGDTMGNGNAATFDLKIAGGGKLERLV